jgi:AraC-like DNA-binding protein
VNDSPDLARPAPARFLALVREPADRFRILNALRGRASVEVVDTIAALEARAADGAVGLIGVLIEPHDLQGIPTAAAVARLRRLLPRVPIIGYCAAGHAHSQEILSLARAGVDELLFQSESDTRTALLAAVASATQQSAAAEVLAAVTPHLKAGALPLVAHCIHHAREALDTDALARAFGMSRATLARRCQEFALPHPWALVGWCRLLVAGYLLQHTTRTVEDLAMSLEFASPSAFRNFVKRYTGLRALDLRASGGVQTVLAMFLAPNALGRRRDGSETGGEGSGGGDQSRETGDDRRLGTDSALGGGRSDRASEHGDQRTDDVSNGRRQAASGDR